MALRLTNTATGKKEEFRPLGDVVSLYTCGPTVYNVAHIGNLASFVAADVLKRWLRASGYTVKHVMNITDVDDKTIRGAAEAELPLAQFTQAHEARFLADIARLNIELPDIVRATAHIDDMVMDIMALKEKGVAYTHEGSTYFSVAKDPHYGEIAHLEARAGVAAKHRVDADEYEKDAVEDFVLWKAWKPEDGEVFWETALGKGRPGWHIECSAMIRRYLGEQIDIHTGGADLLFPHHTNETAQAECISGKRPFVGTWIHRGFLTVNDEKMSKRLGNVLSLIDVAPTDLHALAFRFLLVSSYYRSPLHFTEESYQAAATAYGRVLAYLLKLTDMFGGVKQSAGDAVVLREASAAFTDAMNDDLNTPRAVAALFGILDTFSADNVTPKDAAHILGWFDEIDAVFGVFQKGMDLYRAAAEVSAEDAARLRQLDQERQAKNFAAADAIRDALEARGITVQTTPQGSTGSKNPFI